ncbi:hypothetical protein SDC9_69624 [bioreactor metagenome]|uniref:Uncharacterized protein n=1 Tax=bioreactor metagenome TaxID=1076179 RepID=A0A644Y3N3_9ZZZZ
MRVFTRYPELVFILKSRRDLTFPTRSTEHFVNLFLPLTVIIVLGLALIADTLALRGQTVFLAIPTLNKRGTTGYTESNARFAAPVVQRPGVYSDKSRERIVRRFNDGRDLREKH